MVGRTFYDSIIITGGAHQGFDQCVHYLDQRLVDRECRSLDGIRQMAGVPSGMDFRVELRGSCGFSVWVRKADWQAHRQQKRKEVIRFWVVFLILIKFSALVFWQGPAIWAMIKIGQINPSLWWLIGFFADTFLLVLFVQLKLKRVPIVE